MFECKISPLINTNAFLYYFRRYVKTNQFHQPLLLPALAKDVKVKFFLFFGFFL